MSVVDIKGKKVKKAIKVSKIIKIYKSPNY
jgi:hypothetical protein